MTKNEKVFKKLHEIRDKRTDLNELGPQVVYQEAMIKLSFALGYLIEVDESLEVGVCIRYKPKYAWAIK